MPFCDSVVSDVLANDRQEKFSLQQSTHFHKERELGGPRIRGMKITQRDLEFI